MSKGLIYSDQGSLWGDREITGFGSDDFYIEEIDRNTANEVIIKNHYSKKIFNNAYIHLGVFVKGGLFGVLQFGHLMNNNSVGVLVKGTKNGEALELNRMWLDDYCGRNSESKAISYSMKYIKNKYKDIKWVQSFADERCGGFGIVYQAANFSFYGEYTSDFYELDGEMYHKIAFTNNGKSSSNSSKNKYLKENKDRAKIHTLRQFRYIYFIDKREQKNCTLEKCAYPKHYNETSELWFYGGGVVTTKQ